MNEFLGASQSLPFPVSLSYLGLMKDFACSLRLTYSPTFRVPFIKGVILYHTVTLQYLICHPFGGEDPLEIWRRTPIHLVHMNRKIKTMTINALGIL